MKIGEAKGNNDVLWKLKCDMFADKVKQQFIKLKRVLNNAPIGTIEIGYKDKNKISYVKMLDGEIYTPQCNGAGHMRLVQKSRATGEIWIEYTVDEFIAKYGDAEFINEKYNFGNDNENRNQRLVSAR